MSYRVEFLELALLDLQAITSYITNEMGMPQAAKNLAEFFIYRINLLKDILISMHNIFLQDLWNTSIEE